jgi:hypothetical protein
MVPLRQNIVALSPSPTWLSFAEDFNKRHKTPSNYGTVSLGSYSFIRLLNTPSEAGYIHDRPKSLGLLRLVGCSSLVETPQHVNAPTPHQAFHICCINVHKSISSLWFPKEKRFLFAWKVLPCNVYVISGRLRCCCADLSVGGDTTVDYMVLDCWALRVTDMEKGWTALEGHSRSRPKNIRRSGLCWALQP